MNFNDATDVAAKVPPRGHKDMNANEPKDDAVLNALAHDIIEYAFQCVERWGELKGRGRPKSLRMEGGRLDGLTGEITSACEIAEEYARGRIANYADALLAKLAKERP